MSCENLNLNNLTFQQIHNALELHMIDGLSIGRDNPDYVHHQERISAIQEVLRLRFDMLGGRYIPGEVLLEELGGGYEQR